MQMQHGSWGWGACCLAGQRAALAGDCRARSLPALGVLAAFTMQLAVHVLRSSVGQPMPAPWRRLLATHAAPLACPPTHPPCPALCHCRAADPLNLGVNKEALNWYRNAELQNGRWAMLGVAGIIIPAGALAGAGWAASRRGCTQAEDGCSTTHNSTALASRRLLPMAPAPHSSCLPPLPPPLQS